VNGWLAIVGVFVVLILGGVGLFMGETDRIEADPEVRAMREAEKKERDSCRGYDDRIRCTVCGRDGRRAPDVVTLFVGVLGQFWINGTGGGRAVDYVPADRVLPVLRAFLAQRDERRRLRRGARATPSCACTVYGDGSLGRQAIRIKGGCPVHAVLGEGMVGKLCDKVETDLHAELASLRAEHKKLERDYDDLSREMSTRVGVGAP